MPKLSVLLAVLFFTINAGAQTINVSGSVNDTIQKKGVQNAVVALLNTKDSVLYKFTRTDAGGKYAFKNIKGGEYVIMTTHPYFADIVSNVDIKDAETTIPSIALTSKSKLLEEVIVKSGSPIKIKGDTTVYTADSFKVRAGANVEELLRKLPGITVDKDGKITAMGEQVKKVLVDGEEFFGDDPGIATKNLRADVVKEVEVFDKKSDQAAFTGIDDGIKDKTINLKLKDNAKKGYFGKAEAGTDFKNYYNNSAMANSFRGKRKLAAYGIMSNTGKTNLDWNDQSNYGGGMGDNMVVQDNGDVYFTGGGGDGDNYYGGRGGIPTNWNGGLHYSNKFNNGKHSLNGGYKVSKVNSPSGDQSYTTYFVGPDSSYSGSKISEGFTSKIKQNLSLTYEVNIDSANSLKFTSRGNLNNTRSNSNYRQQAVTTKEQFITTVNNRASSETDNSALNNTLLWKHKFKKNARTLTVNMNYNLSNSNTDGYLYTENNDFINHINDTVDQHKLKDINAHTFATNLTYTEPLMKDLFMSFTYTYSTSTNANEQLTFSKDMNGLYTKRVDSLSNSFLFKQVSNRPGISLRMVKKKYNYSVGLSVSSNSFKQNNRTKLILREYNFTNLFPTASFYYKLSGYGGIRMNYNGSSKAPTLDQLQPIVDNSDRLNQYIGNPDLDQSFTHSASVNYNFYNVLKERGFWSGISGNFIQNAFVNETTIDNSGKSIYRTVNTDGNYFFNLYSNYNFKWKKINTHISFGPNAAASRNISFLKTPFTDMQKSVTTRLSYGFNAGLRKDKEKKYNFSVNTNINWVKNDNSIGNAAADYWQVGINADAELTILKKFRLGSDVNFNAKQKDPRFPANNQFTTWNASLKHNVFKEVLELSVSVNDILSQNRGYERNFSDNKYTETYYNTLKRYWLLTLTWNFSKNGKPTSGF